MFLWCPMGSLGVLVMLLGLVIVATAAKSLWFALFAPYFTKGRREPLQPFQPREEQPATVQA